jgi:hypothetical protein
MSMMDRVELLLRMAQNKADDGDEITAEINARGSAYLAEVRGLLTIAREAVEVLENQEKRFSHFDPKAGHRQVASLGQPTITSAQQNIVGRPSAQQNVGQMPRKE